MSALTRADPGDLLRLAARLQGTAVVAHTAVGSVRAAEVARWTGPAARHFSAVLAEVGKDLAALSDAHADIADVLQVYAGALADAKATAERAERFAVDAGQYPLKTEADAAHVRDLRDTADRLRRDAEQAERDAARTAAAQLDALADRAPDPTRFAGLARAGHDVVDALGDSLEGTAALGGMVWRALPLGRGADRETAARAELGGALVDMLKLWEPVIDVARSLQDERYGQAVGSIGGLIAFRGRGRPGRQPRKAEIDKAQELRVEQILTRIRSLTVPVRQMRSPRDPFDLLHHEALGSHTIREHVGQAEAFLALRASRLGGAATTFPDERTATRAITSALQARAAQIEAWLASGGTRPLKLDVDLGHPVGHGYLPGDPRPRTSTVVRVIVKRHPDGGFTVLTAFPLL